MTTTIHHTRTSPSSPPVEGSDKCPAEHPGSTKASSPLPSQLWIAGCKGVKCMCAHTLFWLSVYMYFYFCSGVCYCWCFCKLEQHCEKDPPRTINYDSDNLRHDAWNTSSDYIIQFSNTLSVHVLKEWLQQTESSWSKSKGLKYSLI